MSATAWFFLILSLLSLAVFLFFGEWYLQIQREKKRYLRRQEDPRYTEQLEARYRKTRRSRIRNFRLYLLILRYEEEGKTKRAQELKPFLRRDFFFGTEIQ